MSAVHIQPVLFKGDIHLSAHEKTAPSQVAEILGEEIPCWIIVAGGKLDFTAKWWAARRYQEVVDAFSGRLLFVQVGEREHCHRPLRGVLDLRGKTDTYSVSRSGLPRDGPRQPGG